MKIFLENKVYLQAYDIMILGAIPACFLPDCVLEEVEQRNYFYHAGLTCSFVIEITSPAMIDWLADTDFILDYNAVARKSPKEIQKISEHYYAKWLELRHEIERVSSEGSTSRKLESLIKECITYSYRATSLAFHLDSLEGRYIVLLPQGYKELAGLRA